MAAVTNLNSTTRQAPAHTKSVMGVQDVYIDFTLPANAVTVKDGNTNTIELCPIAAGTIVKSVSVIVDTPHGAAQASEIGDATDPNGWLVTCALGSAGGTIGAGAYVAAYGKYYAAADTLDLVIANATGTDIDFNVMKLHIIIEYWAK